MIYMFEALYYYQQMYLRTSKIYVLKYMKLDPAKFLLAPGLAWQAALKKAKVKLYFLTDIDILLMVEKGKRWGICHFIYQYAKANNKYNKDCDKNKEFSYIQY